MKVSIFSFAVNDAFPIDIAHRQFKKYMKDDFEYILFNDAYDPIMEKNINTIASFNNITCERVPQRIHGVVNPSECYAQTLNWSLHEYAAAKDFDIVVLMHTDVLPLGNVSILEIVGDYTIASTVEFRKIGDDGIVYLYPAFTIINVKKLKKIGIKELDFGLTPGFDCGGLTKDFLIKYPNDVKLLPNYQASYFLQTLDSNESLAKYFNEDLEISREAGLSSGWLCYNFYHYMAGSGWNANENILFANGHKKRMELFLHYFY